MALITAAGLAGSAITAGVMWGVPKIMDTISNWWSGKGKKSRRGSRGKGGKGRPTVTKTGRIKTTELPGGDMIHEIDKHNPGFAEAFDKHKEEVLKLAQKHPEKWKGLPEFVAQAKDIFGDMPEYQRTEIPEVPEEAELKPFDIEPIKAQAMQRFQGEVIPGLAQRFTNMGAGQRSSAFARQTTRAGERLTGALAELQAREERADASERAKFGMQRAELGMRRAGLMQQQEGEAARMGLLGRGQRFNEAQGLAQDYGRERQSQESWLDRQIRLAQTDFPSGRDTYTQPAQAQQPGWKEALLPSVAKYGTKAAMSYAPDIAKWAKEGITSYFK